MLAAPFVLDRGLVLFVCAAMTERLVNDDLNDAIVLRQFGLVDDV